MSERESRDTAATTRSVNVVHYIERDQDAGARLLATVVDRATDAADSLALLVVTPTTDDALALSEAVWSQGRSDRRRVTALTSMARARRILATNPAAIAASAEQVARLIAESHLDLSKLHSLVLVWPEEIAANPEELATLERVVAEIPKSSERTAICATKSNELAQLLERTMWKARAVDHVITSRSSSPVRAITAPASGQLQAIRSALDALDPASTLLLAFTDAGEAKANAAASILGGETVLRVNREIPAECFDLAVVVDAVPTAEQLTATASIANEVMVIVRPENLGALTKVAPNAVPMTWTGALAHARSAQDALRDEIRGFVESGGQTAWVSVLAPLLDEVDAVDAAAAAMALLDRERRKAKRAAAAPAPAPIEARPQRSERPAFDRTRDARRDERPRRDFREERGGRDFRREERGPRDSRDDRRGRDDKPRRDWSSDQRRGGSARDSARDRDRPPREGRGGRRDDIERVPRAAREGREWSARGERLKHSRRGPRRGDAE